MLRGGKRQDLTPSQAQNRRMTDAAADTSPATASGRCLCGAIHFHVPLPPKWVAHCHCTRCQRAHGAPVVTWLGAHESGSTIDDPQGALRWYVAPETGAERGFCGTCGSPLFFRSARWPGELHVARMQFTDDVGRAPQAHVNWDTHVDWLAFNDELPKKSG